MLKMISGFFVLVVSVILGVVAVFIGREGGLIGGLIMGVSLLAIQLGVRRGKQLRVKLADTVLEKDARPPVLYLRPFEADRKLVRSNPGLPFLEYSYEQDLTRQLRKIGPVIAIGNPSERLPELGAARMYVREGNWQEKVNDLMLRAQLIVLHVGSSPGLQWEIARVVELDLPEKLVVCIPHSADRLQLYADFTACTARIFPRALPSVGDGQALCFGRDWTPQIPTNEVSLPSSATELQRLALASIAKARR